jgi:hypothetical protein
VQKSRVASTPNARHPAVSSSRERKNVTRHVPGMAWLRWVANQEPIRSIVTQAAFENRWGSAVTNEIAIEWRTGIDLALQLD